jgi:hypothetical protein
LAVGFFMTKFFFFVASLSLFSKFKTIHGFGPSIRSSFVLPVLRFYN